MTSSRHLPARHCARGCAASGGATLIELVACLAIGGVLLMLSMPLYSDWIADARLRGQAEALAWSLTRARSEAMHTGNRVTACKSTDGRSCTESGGWDQGWLLFVDDDRDAKRDADEALLYVEGPAPHSISLVGNRPVGSYVSYTSLGHARLLNGGLQMGTFVACMPSRTALHVVLAHSGRVRIERTHDPCP